MDRASDFGSAGCRFDSYRARSRRNLFMRARGSMDRAVDSGSKGCRFDSYRAHENSFLIILYSGPLAQLVEHRIFNPGATGSIPVRLILKLHIRYGAGE